MVDRDIATNRRPVSILIPFILLLLSIGDLARSSLLAFPLSVLGAMLSAGALLFSLWRAWRVLRAMARHGDRAFDRNDKHRLSTEYHGTESASRAHFRKRADR